jgi:ABC-type lipoprotein export system ATPase subunit
LRAPYDWRSPVTNDSLTAAASAGGLSEVYGEGGTHVTALDNLGVEFLRGRFTAIMGPSGSGKSILGYARHEADGSMPVEGSVRSFSVKGACGVAL